MEKLRAENKRYRETNRTAEFEAHAAKLQEQVTCKKTTRSCLAPVSRQIDGGSCMSGQQGCHEAGSL